VDDGRGGTMVNITDDMDDATYLSIIREKYPQIDASGWDYNPETYEFKLYHMKEVRACIQWIQLNAIKTKNVISRYTSYSFKHFVERSASGKMCGEYVSNGSFIAAALVLGYQYKVAPNGVNLFFNMTFSRKMLRQMRGY
jgi:hypothetical protein